MLDQMVAPLIGNGHLDSHVIVVSLLFDLFNLVQMLFSLLSVSLLEIFDKGFAFLPIFLSFYNSF